MKEPDELLIKKIQEGNIEAFEILVKRYQRPLFTFVFKIINDPHDSEDIVQETFFKIYKAIEKVDVKRKFSTYAFEIAKNTAISKLRKNKKQISLSDFDMPINETHYESLFKAENENLVRKALLKTPVKYRKIVGFYYFDELSYDEISKKLGIPINTVRTRLRRGKQMLKSVIQKI